MSIKLSKPVGDPIDHKNRRYRILVSYSPKDGCKTFVSVFPKDSKDLSEIDISSIQLSISEFKKMVEEDNIKEKLSEEQIEFIYNSDTKKEDILKKCI